MHISSGTIRVSINAVQTTYRTMHTILLLLPKQDFDASEKQPFCVWRICQSKQHGFTHRGRTYIESDRMTSSAPMESADQTAWAGGRASTAMVVHDTPSARAV